jgi:hypothetical protein
VVDYKSVEAIAYVVFGLGFLFFLFGGHTAIAVIWKAKAQIARDRRREAEARAKEAKYKALGNDPAVRPAPTEPRYGSSDGRESMY